MSNLTKSRSPQEEDLPGAVAPSDEALVEAAQLGERAALEELVVRCHGYIFNVALRMVYDPDDAADVSQEIVIKLLTRLSSFQGRSSFRTWLYRITVNHVLNMKARKMETVVSSFSAYGEDLGRVPDEDMVDERAAPADLKLLVAEAKISCMLGMLLCLSRDQRAVFVLGEIFDVTDVVGGEVLGLTPANFRQRLSRARRDLYSFMNEKCGLVNQNNPCRCARKTRGFIALGVVDPERLQFAGKKVEEIRVAAPQKSVALDGLELEYARLYQEHGLLSPPDSMGWVREMLARPDVQELFELRAERPD